MSVLLAAGEEIDFPYNGVSFNFGTTAGQFRSGWARCRCNVSQTTPQNLLGMTRTFPAGGVTEIWLSFQLNYSHTASIANRGETGVGNYASLGKGVYVGVGSTASKLAVFKWDGTNMTEIAAESGTSLATSGVQKIDLYVSNIAGTATIKVYLNGTELINHSEDLSGLGIANADCICLLAAGAGSGSWFVSEMIAATEDTRNMGLVTPAPAVGDDTWTGGAASDIAEILLSDDTLAYTNGADDDFSVNLGALPSGTFRILAVQETVRATMSPDATPNGIALGVKSGGTYNYGTKQNLTTNWDTYIRLMLTNPVTTNEWTPAEIDALLLNLRSKT